MDRIEKYREIVRKTIEEYASHKSSIGDIRSEAVIDTEHDHYEVMNVGWSGWRRVHGSVIHVDIIEGKVWIQQDGTDRPVAEVFLEAGIPREDIVLGFQPAHLRQHTDFAVA